MYVLALQVAVKIMDKEQLGVSVSSGYSLCVLWMRMGGECHIVKLSCMKLIRSMCAILMAEINVH